MKKQLPYIRLDLESNSDVYQMLQDIEKFYPPEDKAENSEHSGYKNLIKIVSNKINLLIAGEMPPLCSQLMARITSQFTNLEVKLELENQFPSYALSVNIHEKDLGQIIVVNSLKVKVSLLSKFFTVFHEEKTIHKGINHHTGMVNPVVVNILSSQSSIADQNNRCFVELTKIINSVFSDYRFLSHELLFRKKINYSTPHGSLRQSKNEEFSLYSFLFDSDYQSFHPFYVVP